MPLFFSPIEDPASWTFSVVHVTIPEGVRFAGYTFRGVQASRDSAASIFAPAPGVLQKAVNGAGDIFVEQQINPFSARQIVNNLPWGVPTFYFVFESSTILSFDDENYAEGNEELASSQTVTILMVGQDRIGRDAALWAEEINGALDDGSSWQPFVDALNDGINSGPSAPVLLLDHQGAPQQNSTVDVVFDTPAGETVHRITLEPVDGGDLQKAIARLNGAGLIPIENLWATAVPVRLHPINLNGDPEFDFQLVTVEDGFAAEGEINITPSLRHISFTDLHEWFAKQFATPEDPQFDQLPRYSRNNRLTPFVNGPSFFYDLFRQLHAVDGVGQGIHLTGGFSLFPDVELTERGEDDHPLLPLTIRQAIEHINSVQGGSRFLSAKFIQLEPDEVASDYEIWFFYLLVYSIALFNRLEVLLSLTRTDGGGMVILILLLYLNHALVSYVVGEDGRPLEPMKDAIERLNDQALNSFNFFSPFPATIDDNPALHSATDFPFDVVFHIIRRFGLYHQKIAVVRNSNGFMGYCGGIDLNPNRLDDANHLRKSPYHDVHAKVEGPAMRDLAQTFAERWARDGEGQPLAIATPDVADLEIPPGTLETPSIVQVARTYFAPADPSRRFLFAPDGDRTIFDTTMAAIKQAREYIYLEDQYFTPPEDYTNALCDKVKNRDIHKLIITVPSITDQPFGEIARTNVYERLRQAELEAGASPGDIVVIGYPRRHYTVSDNELRASSGKCLLGEDLAPFLDEDGGDPQSPGTGMGTTIVLGPESRIPSPPFWIAVEGELMWVYAEAVDPSFPDPDTGNKRFLVDRGKKTNLIRGGANAKGPKVRPYPIKKGAATTVVDLSGIFIHAKLILIDDVFLGIGSANINRRGFFHDGEAHLFSIPQALKIAQHNPVTALRQEIWAEMLNLPYEMAAPLLRDPIAAVDLFSRSPLSGNRFVDISGQQSRYLFGATGGGDTILANLLKFAIDSTLIVNHEAIFDGVVDPTSRTENAS